MSTSPTSPYQGRVPDRISKGVPTGGQFAASARAESEVALDEQEPAAREVDLPVGSSWHTDEPIDTLSISAQNRLATELARQAKDGSITLDAPYQRGTVWSADQRIGLLRSGLLRAPIPAIILNDRMTPGWHRHNGALQPGEPLHAVVDGKQRIETMIAWFDGEVPVPASWFEDDEVAATRTAADGTAWVTYDDLTLRGQRRTENRFALPVAVGQVESVQQEAELYLLINGAGTAQTDGDMQRAAQVAAGTTTDETTDQTTSTSEDQR